jgi:glycosyltransferase involved in cell wall biosynthesis
MQICHVVSSLDPSLGGPPVVASRLAAAQAGLGHDVAIVSHDAPDKRAEIDRAMHGIPDAARVKRADRLTTDAQIYHLHGVWESLIRRSATIARRLNKPYVITPHGMLDPWALKQKALKKRIALMLGYRSMLNHAVFLHALNRDEQTLLAPLKLRCPTEVIPNGVFLSEIDQPDAGESIEPTNAGDKPFILFLSRLHYKKGLDYLADAFAGVHKEFPDVKLVVAGPDGGERQPFEQRVADLDLTENVQVIGPVYGRGKYDLMRKAACFCLPSRQEGFSVAILESLACRTPVVISENCHFPEVSEAGAGKVVPLQAARVAEALVEMLRDPHTLRRMGDAGRNLIEQRFTWPKVAEQSISAYQRAIS